MPDYKMKVYKFNVTDNELDEITKYHFTKEIVKQLGIKHTSIFNIINKTHDKARKKWAKYDIEKIREPYIDYN